MLGSSHSLEMVWRCLSRDEMSSGDGTQGLMVKRPLNRDKVRFQGGEAKGLDLSWSWPVNLDIFWSVVVGFLLGKCEGGGGIMGVCYLSRRWGASL